MTDPLLPYAPVDPYLQNAAATPPPGVPMGTDHTALIALVTALLAGAALAQVGRLLADAGDVAPEAASFLLSHPEVRGLLAQSGLASTERPLSLQRRQNAFRKASYLVHAARRLTVSWMLGTQPHYPGHPRTFPGSGLPWTGPGDGLTGRARMAVAWEREKAFLAQHLVAQSKRNGAAVRVAQAWARQGRSGLLGWRARMDSRTSGECRAANGRNFNPARIPPIGYPGSVHVHCRCIPVAPFATSLRVEDLYDGAENRTVAAATPGWAVRVLDT